MSKYKRLVSTSDEDLINVVKACGSMLGTLRHFGFPKGDSRARTHIRAVVDKHGVGSLLTQYLTSRPEYNEDDVRLAVEQSFCMSDVLAIVGLSNHGNNYKTIKKIIERKQISTAHFDKAVVSGRNKKVYTYTEIFCEGSKYSRSSLGLAVKRFNVLPYVCVGCGNTGVWLDQPINLVVDHINGVNDDNRVENLRYLCYNCHSLTDTFAGRNVSRSVV